MYHASEPVLAHYTTVRFWYFSIMRIVWWPFCRMIQAKSSSSTFLNYLFAYEDHDHSQ